MQGLFFISMAGSCREAASARGNRADSLNGYIEDLKLARDMSGGMILQPGQRVFGIAHGTLRSSVPESVRDDTTGQMHSLAVHRIVNAHKNSGALNINANTGANGDTMLPKNARVFDPTSSSGMPPGVHARGHLYVDTDAGAIRIDTSTYPFLWLRPQFSSSPEGLDTSGHLDTSDLADAPVNSFPPSAGAGVGAGVGAGAEGAGAVGDNTAPVQKQAVGKKRAQAMELHGIPDGTAVFVVGEFMSPEAPPTSASAFASAGSYGNSSSSSSAGNNNNNIRDDAFGCMDGGSSGSDWGSNGNGAGSGIGGDNVLHDPYAVHSPYGTTQSPQSGAVFGGGKKEEDVGLLDRLQGVGQGGDTKIGVGVQPEKEKEYPAPTMENIPVPSEEPTERVWAVLHPRASDRKIMPQRLRGTYVGPNTDPTSRTREQKIEELVKKATDLRMKSYQYWGCAALLLVVRSFKFIR